MRNVILYVTLAPVSKHRHNDHNMIKSFHSIRNIDRGVLQAMWDELAGQVRHRDQLIIC